MIGIRRSQRTDSIGTLRTLKATSGTRSYCSPRTDQGKQKPPPTASSTYSLSQWKYPYQQSPQPLSTIFASPTTHVHSKQTHKQLRSTLGPHPPVKAATMLSYSRSNGNQTNSYHKPK